MAELVLSTTATNSSQTNITAMTATAAVDSVTEWSDAGEAADRPWDTSDPFFSAETRELVKLVFKCYTCSIINFLGALGNIICLTVFWKQGLSDRINLLLFWLAVIDLCNQVCQLFSTATCYLADSVARWNLGVIVSAHVSRVFITCGYVSGALIVVLSVERCLFVVAPFKARRLLTYRSMVAAIVLSYLIPFLACFNLLLGNTVKWRLDPSTNRSVAYMVTTDWFPASKLQSSTSTFFNLISQPLSFILVVVCSTITIIYLRRTSRQRSQMTGKSGEDRSAADNRLTVMLLLLCISYAVLCLCQICINAMMNFVAGFFLYKKYHNSFIVLYNVFVLTMSSINSTINFWAYLVLSSRFRATLKELCPCFCRKDTPGSTSTAKSSDWNSK